MTTFPRIDVDDDIVTGDRVRWTGTKAVGTVTDRIGHMALVRFNTGRTVWVRVAELDQAPTARIQNL